MTRRFALIDASEGTVLAVRAALGAGSVEVCRRGAIPANTPLQIVEAGADPLRDEGLVDGPVLVLADWSGKPAVELGSRRFDICEKPFGSDDLRQKIRSLLEPSLAIEPDAGADWLRSPLLEPSAASILASARTVDSAVWIVGETGTGPDSVAAALALAWDGRGPVVWEESESLAAAAARLGDAGAVLWAPGIDERPVAEQRAFERYLAAEPRRRSVVTSGDRPEGRLPVSLSTRLSRLSVRLAPLRERRLEIAALAIHIGGEVARRARLAGGLTLTDAARRDLEAYAWPGNTDELDAVVTRSVLSRADASSRKSDLTPFLELDAGHLLFEPNHLAPLFEQDAAETEPAAPARRVVVALSDVAAARAASAASASALEATAVQASSPQTDGGIEGVLAGFAHDIRNPMSTIKTFAGLAAASPGDSSELARLAMQACERVDEQLELLQRYSEITDANPTELDLVEVLGEAADAAGAADDLAIHARRALLVKADAALARLAADAIVGECRVRRAPESGDEVAAADIGAAIAGSGPNGPAGAPVGPAVPPMAMLEIIIPTGRAAVDRLNKWVSGRGLPWRLALARDAVRRSGGSLEVEVEESQLRLAWRLPQAGMAGKAEKAQQLADVAGERGNNDHQTGSPDRRRRSRSS